MTQFRLSAPLGVEDVRQAFADLWFQVHSDPPQMVELVGTSFVADEPSIISDPNAEYIARELEWYLSNSLNVHTFPGGAPPIWHKVADQDGNINSNYGNLVFSEENGSQYHEVAAELRRDRASRRGTMIYTRPEMHTDATFGGRSDFVCTNAVNYFIRDDLLHCVVQMRSNDAVFGYPNDYAWQLYVLELLAGDLDVGPAQIVWQAASLHVYPRHYHYLNELIGA